MSSNTRNPDLHTPRKPAFVITALSLMAVVSVLLGGGSALKAEPGLAPLETTYNISQVVLQKAPTLYKFNARVSQAKMPSGNGSFATVYVTVMSQNDQTQCTEQFNDVQVRDGVLNLVLGGNMSCGDLETLVATSTGLSFKICLQSQTNCLRPIQIGSVPFATKASFAQHANQADRANVAAQAHYAHRISVSPSMLVSNELRGYFDFASPSPEALASLYPGDDPAVHQDAGYLQWTPNEMMSSVDGTDSRLNICSKQVSLDGIETLEHLDELALSAEVSRMRGDAYIEGNATTAGNQSVGQTLGVGGDATVTGSLTVEANASIATGLVVNEGPTGPAVQVNGSVAITEELTVTQGGTVSGALNVSQGADVMQGLEVTQGTAEHGLKVNGSGHVTQRLQVDDGVIVTGSGSIADGLSVTQGEAAHGLLVDGSGVITKGLSVENGGAVSGGMKVTEGLIVQQSTAPLALDVEGTVAVSQELTVGQEDAPSALTVHGSGTIADGLAVSTASDDKVGLSVAGGATIANGLSVAECDGDQCLSVDGSAVVSAGLTVRQGDTEAGLSVEGATILDGHVSLPAEATLACKARASFEANTTFGTQETTEPSTMSVYAKATFHGDVSLAGKVTTANPIPGVVAENEITTEHLQDGSVTEAKLKLETAAPGMNAEDFQFSGNGDQPAEYTVTGTWQFCALTEVQVAASMVRGRCLVHRDGSTWKVLVLGPDTRCAINCF